ncbi:hypothetical protein B0H19DRAFT_1103386 [Mycena capillaripes]|nr:hypothetical protein B0H19DRAFT_1103386 [Mycena capillaripes]
MARSRLTSLPPELKLEIYSYLEHNELLPLSHVSKLWRSLVLQDSRWNKWFEMIASPKNGESFREIMERFKVLDVIPRRTIVNLCFDTECSVCGENTPFLFLPLLRRLCDDCLQDEAYEVMCLSVALTMYDLSEKDVRDVVVLHWEEETDPEKKKSSFISRVKVVSTAAVKNVAIEKYGGEDALATRLKDKKARVRKAYEKRLSAYNTAIAEREQLKRRGDAAGAAAVTLKNSGKAPQKTRPKLPSILKNAPFTPPFYRYIGFLQTNFLAADPLTGHLTPQKLIECKMCNVMANLRFQDLPTAEQPETGPDYRYMLSGLLAEHEKQVHHAREGDRCLQGCAFSDGYWGRCDTCLNAEALETKAHLVQFGAWED